MTAAREAIGRLFSFVFIVDDQATMVAVSPEITDVMGYDVDQVLGRSSLDFLHPDDHDMVLIELAKELAEDNVSQAVTVRLVDADGLYRSCELLGSNQLGHPELEGIVVGVRDLTGLRVDRRAAAASQYLFHKLATTATDFTLIADDRGHVIHVSPTMPGVLGWSEAQIFECRNLPELLLMEPDRAPFDALLQRIQAIPGAAERIEVRAKMANGGSRWIEATMVNLLGDPDVAGLVAHGRDITDRREREATLRYLADHDPLTGLSNRLSFMERLSAEVPSESRVHGGVALMFCDLDGFKQVNDSLGHHVGDMVLRELGERLHSAVRPADVVARIGGDEFCVLCSNLDEQVALEVAARIRDAMNRPLTTVTSDLIVGVSIGVAWSADGQIGASTLLAEADRFMYRAKSMGRNGIELVTV
jgi:diguanylate cyclase (GGDEF)-like protein/PAS domain S-box-containing protein